MIAERASRAVRSVRNFLALVISTAEAPKVLGMRDSRDRTSVVMLGFSIRVGCRIFALATKGEGSRDQVAFAGSMALKRRLSGGREMWRGGFEGLGRRIRRRCHVVVEYIRCPR